MNNLTWSAVRMIKGDVLILNIIYTLEVLNIIYTCKVAVEANKFKFSDKHETKDYTIIYPLSQPHWKKGSCLNMNISISMREYQIMYVEVVTMSWRIWSLKHEPFFCQWGGEEINCGYYYIYQVNVRPWSYLYDHLIS